MPSEDRSSSEAGFGVGTEQQVEKLVADIGGIVRAAEPERRGGLKELAETLLHQEFATIAEEKQSVEAEPRRSRSNPLAAGILLFLLGLGFAIIIPLVGLTLACIGLVLALSGAAMSWFRK